MFVSTRAKYNIASPSNNMDFQWMLSVHQILGKLMVSYVIADVWCCRVQPWEGGVFVFNKPLLKGIICYILLYATINIHPALDLL